MPSVDRLTLAAEALLNGHALPRALVVEAARAELDAARRALAAQRPAPSPAELARAVAARLEHLAQPSLRPVINASGVIIQTNLGRAPLSQAALAAMAAVGAGYSNLEYDLEAGERGFALQPSFSAAVPAHGRPRPRSR